jgi:hypothetical protein
MNYVNRVRHRICVWTAWVHLRKRQLDTCTGVNAAESESVVCGTCAGWLYMPRFSHASFCDFDKECGRIAVSAIDNGGCIDLVSESCEQ